MKFRNQIDEFEYNISLLQKFHNFISIKSYTIKRARKC